MDDRKGKVVYFAHPMSHYDTDFEWECIDTIIHMLTPIGEDPTEGFIHIMNPNQKWLSTLYKRRLHAGDEDPFEIFREIATSCSMIVGVSFMNGDIGAGVAEEIKSCIEVGIPAYLIFLHAGQKLFMPVTNIDEYRILSRKDTRDRKEKGVM